MSAAWRRDESPATLRKLNRDLYNFVRSRTPQAADAADLVSDVWEITYRKFEGRCALRNFLFAVARRRLCEFWRAGRQPAGLRTASEDDPTAVFEALPCDEDLEAELDAAFARRHGHAAIRRALSRVKESYRGVIELRLVGYSYQDLMDEFGISYHTARSRTARGKAQLIAALAKQRGAKHWDDGVDDEDT